MAKNTTQKGRAEWDCMLGNMWAWRFWHQTELLARSLSPICSVIASISLFVPLHGKSHMWHWRLVKYGHNNNKNFCLLLIICYPGFLQVIWFVYISYHCALVSLKRENDCDLKQNTPRGHRWHGSVTQTFSQEANRAAGPLGFLPVLCMKSEYLHTVLLSNLRNATQTKHQQRERGRWEVLVSLTPG